VDEKQKLLGEIYAKVESLEKQKQDLVEKLARERQALDDDLALETREYFGNFQGVMNGYIYKLNEDLAALEQRLQAAQEEVRLAFAEQKRVEIVDERRKEEAAQELKQKESQEMDEIGIEGFRRQTLNDD
jgi:flagellar export protein FliJ